jgi:hypothetical protein
LRLLERLHRFKPDVELDADLARGSAQALARPLRAGASVEVLDRHTHGHSPIIDPPHTLA